MAILAAVLGMFQFGFNTGVINAPQAEIEKFIATVYKERHTQEITAGLASTIFSLAVSAFLVGGMIGGLSGGWLANKLGRKGGLFYTQLLSVSGAVASGVSVPAGAYELLIIGRLLIGLACGLFTGLVPLYVSEIAPVNLRGGMGTINQLAVTFGIFTSMVLGLNKVLGSATNWPYLISLTAVPAIVQFILLYFMPESPRYLILDKKEKEAGKKALKILRGTEDVDEEFEEIVGEGTDANDAEVKTLSVFGLLMSPKLRLSLFVTVCMHLSQQLSGIVAIFYYSTNFFQSAGIGCDDAQYGTMGVGAIMVTMTIVTIPLMDRLGRRTLHLVGMIGMIICTILITIALNVSQLEGTDCTSADAGENHTEHTNGVGIFNIISTLSMVAFFAFGPGSIPWLITGELFTQGPRSAAVAVATFVNWSGNLIVGLVFPQMQKAIQTYSFVPFTAALVLLFAVLYWYLPETKNRPVQEVVAMFQIPHAWKRPIGRRGQTATTAYGATETTTVSKDDEASI